MRVLVADDDRMARTLLAETLGDWGYEVVEVADGATAWEVLQAADPPRLAILDWEMPGLTGPDVCRQVRGLGLPTAPYLMLLTHREGTANLVEGLDSGANDYLSKPFDRDELAARLKVGREVVRLQDALAARVAELEQALAEVKQLRGTLPICAWCKKIRDDANYWGQVEDYLARHTGAEFSHGICPDCLTREVGQSHS